MQGNTCCVEVFPYRETHKKFLDTKNKLQN